MKYFFPSAVLIISLIGAILFYSSESSKVVKIRIHPLEYGGVVWPKNIAYEVDKTGDIHIELQDPFTVYEGKWPSGTKFFFNGNNLSKIHPKVPFVFAEIEFKQKVEITLEDFPPHKLHIFNITEAMVIDGLDLHPGCQLQFKDSVLYAANCENFGTVYFKRAVELPENALDEEV